MTQTSLPCYIKIDETIIIMYFSAAKYRSSGQSSKDNQDCKASSEPDKEDNSVENQSEPCSDKVLFNWEDNEFNQTFEKVLCSSLVKIRDDPFRQMSISVSGKGIIEIANSLIGSEKKKEELKGLLQDKFYAVITNKTDTDSNTKEAIFSKFHKLTGNQEVSEKLQDIISVDMGQHLPFRQFVGILLHKILGETVLERSKMLEKTAEKRSSELSDNDQSILFYISGYVISALHKQASKKKVQNKKLQALQEAMQVSLKRESDSEKTFIAKYSSWTEKINRGGLKIPSDIFYLFIRECEMCCREMIDEKNLHKDIFNIELLKEKIMDKFMIKYYTEKFTTGEFSTYIKERCITLFLTVRGHASARKRKCEQADEEPKKSLRKVLKDCTNNKKVKQSC